MSDEPDWVRSNLESLEDNIYFVGSVKQSSTDDSVTEDIEQRGNTTIIWGSLYVSM